jgi:hypothetical protein
MAMRVGWADRIITSRKGRCDRDDLVSLDQITNCDFKEGSRSFNVPDAGAKCDLRPTGQAREDPGTYGGRQWLNLIAAPLSPSSESKMLFIRGHKVMLDHDLAKLYEVPTKALNQAVKRNQERFPSDFMFQLTPDESQVLRSQFVTLESGSGRHSKYLPYVFTEQGVAMLSTVLRSKRAIQVNVEIMRAFARFERRAGTQACCAGKEIRRSV